MTLSRQRSSTQANRFSGPIILWLSLLTALPAFAGHGFMSAFGNIEWLPDPGRTPDSAWYILDVIEEEGNLLVTRDPAIKLQLSLSFAKKKLAELEAMVKIEQQEAAQTAADRYQTYLTRVKELLDSQNEQAQKETLAESAATALLEHQYILATIYPDLPSKSRPLLLETATTAGTAYQEVIKLLPAKKKGALFFKEEEVRWSLQMAARADEEGQVEATTGK